MSNKKYTIKNDITVEATEDIYKYLVKTDRRIRYVDKDLKRSRCIIVAEK